MPPEIGIPTVEIREGSARILVPDPQSYKRGEEINPAWAPVFYNPRASPSRSIAVLFLRAYASLRNLKEIKVVEPLSATGVRGIRFALEVDAVARVYLNDLNPLAYKLILANAKINGVSSKVIVGNEDANLFMLKYWREMGGFDYVDIDPFGTSLPFIETALTVVKHRGIIALTFTDVAVPYGTYPKKSLRRYLAYSIRTPFSYELALRVLLGFLCRTAAQREIGIVPLLSYYYDYYVRIFIEVWKNRRNAKESLINLGFILYCASCGFREAIRNYPFPPEKVCPVCKKKLIPLGPLWLTPYAKKEIINKMIEEAREKGAFLTARDIKLLSILGEELLDVPYYYTVSELGKRLKVAEPSPKALVSMLRDRGIRSSLVHCDSKGFKADLPHESLMNTLTTTLTA